MTFLSYNPDREKGSLFVFVTDGGIAHALKLLKSITLKPLIICVVPERKSG